MDAFTHLPESTSKTPFEVLAVESVRQLHDGNLGARAELLSRSFVQDFPQIRARERIHPKLENQDVSALTAPSTRSSDAIPRKYWMIVHVTGVLELLCVVGLMLPV